MTDQGPVAWRVRTRLIPLLTRFLFRLDAVRRSLFRTVSQIGVNYRGSPLSEGAAGSVKGGDRLPWVETGQAEDNFTPLMSLVWQVHVYGEPRPGIADACAELSLPIHAFPWTPEMGQSGLVRGALYLVRPDGYIALADPNGDPERLGRYFMNRGLPATPRRDESTRVDALPGQPRIAQR